MLDFLARVTIFCFAASYGVALALELWHLVQPRPILRYVAIGFGSAGVLAHLFYLVGPATGGLSLVAPAGSLLLLALILSVFYVYGSNHHRRVAWGLFVLPLVLGLVVLAVAFPPAPTESPGSLWDLFRGERFWGTVHGVLVLLAAVGISVGFVASVMYFVQAHRLKAKLAPSPGMKMLSLERIDAMNRRAVLWSFPLLTAGLGVSMAMLLAPGAGAWNWSDPKILSTIGLWIVFAVLLYLRYAVHVRGKQAALWTIIAFVLLVVALALPHPLLGGAP